LQQVFKGESCKDQNQKKPSVIGGLGGLPPAYLSVPNHRDCLGRQMMGTSGHLCLLNEKPDGCPQESFDKLHQVFKGTVCEDQDQMKIPILGGVDSLPPAYLSVPKHRDCLGSQMIGSSGHLCQLTDKPDGCPQESFDRLQEVFEGDLCRDQNQKKISVLTGLPPAYLSVPQHRDCLGSKKVGSSSQFCLPFEKPEACPQESFNQLRDVFEGDMCTIELIEVPMLGGESSLPPEYLSVDGWKDCLRGFEASDSHTEQCLPDIRPNSCSVAAYKQLQELVFSLEEDRIGKQVLFGDSIASPKVDCSVIRIDCRQVQGYHECCPQNSGLFIGNPDAITEEAGQYERGKIRCRNHNSCRY